MTAGAVPKVAVCVPVHRDGADLEQLLGAIDAVEWPADRLDVVVALDGGDPDLRRIAIERGAAVVELPERRGSYAARNLALATLDASVEIVVFTDADCIPQRGWIRAHVDALQHADLSGGAIDVTLRDRPSPAEFVDRIRHLHQETYVTIEGFAATANLAVRREVAALGFDAALQSGGDAEFCRRATAAGHRLVYTPDAVVLHPARRTTREVLKKVRRIGRGVESRPGHWAERPAPEVKPRKWLAHRARREGVSPGVAWELRVIALDLVASTMFARSVKRAKAAA